jgi:hypothetical protein
MLANPWQAWMRMLIHTIVPVHIPVKWPLLVQFIPFIHINEMEMTPKFLIKFFTIISVKSVLWFFELLQACLQMAGLMRFNGRFVWLRNRQNSAYVITMPLLFSLTELREPWGEGYDIERNPSAILLNFLVSTNKMADIWICEAGAILAPRALFFWSNLQ